MSPTFWSWLVAYRKSLCLTGVFCLVIAAVGYSMGASYFCILSGASLITLMMVALVMMDFEADKWVLLIAAAVGSMLGMIGYVIGLAVIGILQWGLSETLLPGIIVAIYAAVLMLGIVAVPWSMECIGKIVEGIIVSRSVERGDI